MAKMKSHSGAKKRFIITAGNKVKHKQQGKNHNSLTKNTKRIRDLRSKTYLEGQQAATIKQMVQK